MMIDMKTVAAMDAAGIRFEVGVRTVGGWSTILIRPDEVPAYMNDADQFAADRIGVARGVYLEWVETDGTPRCGATTKRGTRCRNLVSGGIQFPIQEWLQLNGGYCTVHGGEGSEEAKTRRWGR